MKQILFTLILLSWITLAFGQQQSDTRNVSSFNKINIAGGIDKVVLVEGNSPKVSIETDGISPEKVLTDVNGGCLNIHLKNGNYHGKVRLTVTYQKLREINNSGSTDLFINTELSGEQFTFNNSGSGDLSGKFNVDKLSVNMSGSGDSQLRGKARTQQFATSGSGDIDASELRGETANVQISGSGDVTLNVSGKVNSAVAGSGDVRNTKDNK